MLNINFLYLLLLLQLDETSTIGADVVTVAPDLSHFKLRPVNIKTDSDLQLGQPIHDLGVAAKLLHDAFFVKDQRVHCIAYGHLFKMIEARRIGPNSAHLPPVEQTTINALAVVAEVDRAIYLQMFLDECLFEGTQAMADLFAEAMQQLDRWRGVEARDTWLDLMRCATAHFDTELNNFLRNETHLIRAQALMEFNSRQVNRRLKKKPKTVLDWILSATKVEWTPSIRDLVKKFDGIEPDWRPILKDELAESRKIIESSDDAELASLRQLATVRFTEKNRDIHDWDRNDSPWNYNNKISALIALGRSTPFERELAAQGKRAVPVKAKGVLIDNVSHQKPRKTVKWADVDHERQPGTNDKANGLSAIKVNRIKPAPQTRALDERLGRGELLMIESREVKGGEVPNPDEIRLNVPVGSSKSPVEAERLSAVRRENVPDEEDEKTGTLDIESALAIAPIDGGSRGSGESSIVRAKAHDERGQANDEKGDHVKSIAVKLIRLNEAASPYMVEAGAVPRSGEKGPPKREVTVGPTTAAAISRSVDDEPEPDRDLMADVNPELEPNDDELTSAPTSGESRGQVVDLGEEEGKRTKQVDVGSGAPERTVYERRNSRPCSSADGTSTAVVNRREAPVAVAAAEHKANDGRHRSRPAGRAPDTAVDWRAYVDGGRSSQSPSGQREQLEPAPVADWPRREAPATDKRAMDIELDVPVRPLEGPHSGTELMADLMDKADIRMALARYTMMRLDIVDKSREPRNRHNYDFVHRLTTMIAFDFVEHWTKLRMLVDLPQARRLNPRLYARVKQFMGDKAAIRAAARINEATREYQRLVGLIGDLQEKQARRSFRSYRELESETNEALSLLGSLGEILELDHIERGFGQRAKYELKQYTTLNKYVNGGFW